MLETDSLVIGTAAEGSVSFDKAWLMSAFSAWEGENKTTDSSQ